MSLEGDLEAGKYQAGRRWYSSSPVSHITGAYHTARQVFSMGEGTVVQDGNFDAESNDDTVAALQHGEIVNASGYQDQLKRQYSLLGLAGIALTVDNAWVALGSSISVSIRTFNSGAGALPRS